MPILKTSSPIDCTIDLHSRGSGDRGTYTSDNDIRGTVTFTVRKRFDNVRYRIVVKGTVETRINEYPHGSLNNNTRVETYTFLYASLYDHPSPSQHHHHHHHQSTPQKIPFTLSLQKLESTLRPGTNPLPTTNSHHTTKRFTDNFKSTRNFEYFTTYEIIASACQDDKKLLSLASKEFEYVPLATRPAPPVPIEDFPDEYRLRTTEMLRKHEVWERLGVVSEEPAAVVMRMDDEERRDGFTDVKGLLMLIGNGNVPISAARLPKQCRVRASLRATTFVMSKLSPSVMHTMNVAERMDDAVVQVEKACAQEYVMSLERLWELPEAGSEGGISTAAISVPFRISGEQRRHYPTFHSPLLSRRYAIDLALDFPGDSLPTVKLRLPVQLLYRSGGRSFSTGSDLE